MEQAVRTVEQWAQLSREALVAAVVAAVRQPPADPTRLWGAVKADTVLAATVRGILAGLLREKAGTRDEVFWTYRVTTVRAVLNSPEPVVDARRPPRPKVTVAAPAAPVPRTEVPKAAVAVPPAMAVPAIEFLAPG
jgi:hypothetical protein